MAERALPAQSERQIRLRVGGRVYAGDPYWPFTGRPVKKERVVDGATQVTELFPGHMPGPWWRWKDPKNDRLRWCSLEDADAV